MTTDTKHTPDPTPAPLPPARLAEVRARADAPLRPMPDAEERAEYFGQAIADRAALLAHLDALTPRAVVDGEALGRRAWRERASPESRERYPEFEALMDEAWETQSAEERARYQRIGTALHAIGHAAGRSEGEAERVRATQEGIDIGRAQGWKEANVEIDRLVAARASMREAAERRFSEFITEIARLTEECDAERVAVLDRDATIARLTAELARLSAENLTRIDAAKRNADAAEEIERRHLQEVAAARLDGAREEREACALIAEEEERLLYRQDGEQACARVRRRIRARATEGRQGS